jgi:hypothetical protein
MKDEMSKLTAEIDKDIYLNIAKNLHHGQMTQLIRAFALSLNQLINNGDKKEFYMWLYGSKSLTLPPPEEKDNA